MLLITSTTRTTTLLFSPLRLPTYIFQILADSVLGHLPHLSNLVFPIRNLFILESWPFSTSCTTPSSSASRSRSPPSSTLFF
uniref:Uncharacterized protein n=1 Tax=Oryza rufipogon TaxID=4529 RepID=A0A0E0RD22_ORYRU